MDVLFDRAAGLDIGKKSVTVCVRTPGSRGRRHSETRTFSTMSRSLQEMTAWVLDSGVTLAGMESTSTHWKPAAAVTEPPTAPFTSSPSSACDTINPVATMWTGAPLRA